MEGNNKTAYFFTSGSSKRRDLIGAVIERGPAGIGMIFVLLFAAFGLYIWSQHDLSWYESLMFLLPVLVGSWHYLSLVVEIRVTPEHISFRRLVNFRSIPWEKISRVRAWSFTISGVTCIWITGHSSLPLAVFLLLSGYTSENWKELTRLLEQLSKRVPVKHTK